MVSLFDTASLGLDVCPNGCVDGPKLNIAGRLLLAAAAVLELINGFAEIDIVSLAVAFDAGMKLKLAAAGVTVANVEAEDGFGANEGNPVALGNSNVLLGSDGFTTAATACGFDICSTFLSAASGA